LHTFPQLYEDGYSDAFWELFRSEVLLRFLTGSNNDLVCLSVQ
jgi:hypothetical protein